MIRACVHSISQLCRGATPSAWKIDTLSSLFPPSSSRNRFDLIINAVFVLVTGSFVIWFFIPWRLFDNHGPARGMNRSEIAGDRGRNLCRSLSRIFNVPSVLSWIFTSSRFAVKRTMIKWNNSDCTIGSILYETKKSTKKRLVIVWWI